MPSASQVTAAASVKAPPKPSSVWNVRPVLTNTEGRQSSPCWRVSGGCSASCVTASRALKNCLIINLSLGALGLRAPSVNSLGPEDVVDKNLGVGDARLVVASLAKAIRNDERVSDFGQVKD